MTRWFRFTTLLVFFALLLSVDCARSVPIDWDWLRQWRDELVFLVNSGDVQKLEILAFAAYLVGFGIRLHSLRKARSPGAQHATSVWEGWNLRTACLIGLCAAVLVSSFLGDSKPGGMIDAVVLFWGMLVGQGLLFLKLRQRNPEQASKVHEDVLDALILVLAFSSLVRPDWWEVFPYHGQRRWQGPWWNPNHFGLLMATGMVLAIGQGLQKWRWKPAAPSRWLLDARYRWLGFYALGVVLMGIGLVKSYSRGAWLGAGLGLTYLGFHVFKLSDYQTRISRIVTNKDSAGGGAVAWYVPWIRSRIALGLIMVSVVVVAFWTFRQTEFLVARRAFSVGNVNDLSWRNRLVAYQGALQMMAARPWFGFSWDRPTDAFDQFFKPNRLVDPRAIQLNDYFTVGLTLGLPALACFVGYLFLSLAPLQLVETEASPECSPGKQDQWLKVVCRAGLIVLLVGFWLQRGLFWMALTIPFWVLLELGGTESERLSLGQVKAPLSFRSFASPRFGAAGAVLLCFVGGLMWASARDPFKRIEFSLKTSGGGTLRGTAILPKPVRKYATVIYLYGSGGSLSASGRTLRQMAELGLAAVGIEYNQTNRAAFDEELIALNRYLAVQPWTQSNATAWVGFSLGAQKTLGFFLNHPEIRPQVLVRLAGGWVSELNEFRERDPRLKRSATGLPSLGAELPTVLLVHGEQDDIFPVAQAEGVAAALRTNGFPVELRILPGQVHDFEPNRDLLSRAVGEYCLAHLKGADALRNYCSVAAWQSQVKALWVYWLPPALWAGGWFYLRRRTRDPRLRQVEARRTRTEIGLWWLAVVLGTAALAQTTLHLAVPRLSVSEKALAFARRFLVQSKRLEDFNHLASNYSWQGKPLKCLLDNVELASYNRELVNWKLDDRLYQEFVLSPVIAGSTGEQLNWRRPLWEDFYPRIRKEQTLESAAEAVACHLRERVTIADFPDSPKGIESIWRAQIADAQGFELIYVAALRSGGIPARLDAQGKAEFWTGSKWRPAPRPLMTRWE